MALIPTPVPIEAKGAESRILEAALAIITCAPAFFPNPTIAFMFSRKDEYTHSSLGSPDSSF